MRGCADGNGACRTAAAELRLREPGFSARRSHQRGGRHAGRAEPAAATAIRVLVEEVEKRTAIRLRVSAQWPAETVPAIAVGPLSTASTWAAAGLKGLPSAAAPGKEGYRLAVNAAARRAPTVLVLGADTRGTLFGVGRLLRNLEMSRANVRVASGLAMVSTPQVALRGHQLGYRPKTNSYDAWDVPMWEQYIRDLAVFGTNAIELIPPRSDDDADSPHFPLPPMRDDGRDVAHRRRVRARRVDLVSGDGPRLRRSEDGGVRRSRSGPRSSPGCRASTPCSCPAATPGTRSRRT